ncbi:hypothetical protein RND81_03G045100 [Saponaria officinalis]|uniref:NAC domain-containing protein n=1 Tax=Saponaria officinalis TaxID=3572 RepID=A0AAW1M4N4_SAPOF
MCRPGPSSLSDIGVYWTDQELIVFLDKIQHGSPPPSNVLVDVNPFQHKPSSLPDGMWYFVLTDTEKGTEAETGVWKVLGDGCQIYEDSKLTGWRSTFEFYKGSSDDRHRTNWVMQKYWTMQKGTHSVKVSGSLCRVFHRDVEHRKQKRQRHLEPVSVIGQESLLQEEHNSRDTQNILAKEIFLQVEHNSRDTQNIPAKGSEVIVRHDNTKSSDPGESPEDLDCFCSGDYLELLDLVNPGSSTSSSDNSSCVSMASDEIFDYLELLNDLEPENSKHSQSSSTSCHLSVSTSSVPKVVVSPATRGSFVTQVEGHAPAKSLELEHPLSCPVNDKNDNSATSHAGKNHKDIRVNSTEAVNHHEASSSKTSATDKGKKIAHRKMKMLKNLCFFPF